MDGAYYALKGYAYQFDKTVIDILTDPDETKQFGIEQIQDLNCEHYVMQIKYKEAHKYSSSQIREPVLQLLEEFKKNSEKTYFLYCHFKDKDEGEEALTLTGLNDIIKKSKGTSNNAKRTNLRIDTFTEKDKSDFLNNFKLVFAPAFQEQFCKVLDLLRSHLKVNNDEELIFYYSQIEHILIRIVLENINPQDRICNKKQILDTIQDAKKQIFTSSFADFQGKEKFFKFVKAKLKKPRKQRQNVFIIGEVEIDAHVSLADLIEEIVDQYFKKARIDICPPTFFICEKYLETTKTELLNRQLFFNDGYEAIEFNTAAFAIEPVKNNKSAGKRANDNLGNISFKCRIAGLDNIDQVNKQTLDPEMLYIFDSTIPSGYSGVSHFNVDNFSTNQIRQLFE